MKEDIVKRTAQQLVEDVYLSVMVDQSTSMDSVREATINAYNRYLQEVGASTPVRYSGALFNDRVTPLDGKTTTDGQRLHTGVYVPSGSTALYDCIADRIRAIDDLSIVPFEVLFVVFSDGEDNSSRMYSREAVRELIVRKMKLGWRFVFFAPDERTRATAVNMGFDAANVATYGLNAKGLDDAFTRLARGAKRFIAAAEIGALPPARFFED